MKFAEAVLILSGMIIGVGMFGIPFSFVKVGFWFGALELAAAAGLILLLHLLYGEIVLGTRDFHRLPGYVRIYLGRRASFVSWGAAIFGILGTLLAYTLLGATFLETLFGGFFNAGLFWWAAVLVFSSAAITFFPLKKGAAINGILTALLIIFIFFLSVALFPKVNTENLKGISAANFFLPYGVLLFALSGGVVIPDVVTVLGKEKRLVRRAIVLGSLIPVAVYFIFSFAVVGSSGSLTSADAVSGLLPVLGSRAVFWGSVIGFLAVFTSFVVLSSSFQALLRIDFKMEKFTAWAAASFLPLFLYFLGFQDFLLVIGAVGAIALGVDATLVLFSHKQMKAREGVAFSTASFLWRYVLAAVLLAGVVYEILKISWR